MKDVLFTFYYCTLYTRYAVKLSTPSRRTLGMERNNGWLPFRSKTSIDECVQLLSALKSGAPALCIMYSYQSLPTIWIYHAIRACNKARELQQKRRMQNRKFRSLDSGGPQLSYFYAFMQRIVTSMRSLGTPQNELFRYSEVQL